MSHFKNIKVQKVENILSQIGYTTSRGADIFSRSSHENHKNISNIHDLRIDTSGLPPYQKKGDMS